MHKHRNHLYALRKPMTKHQILEKASEIIADKFAEKDAFCNAKATQEYLRFKLGKYEREVFAVMLLDNQNQLSEYRELFFGTIDSATIHPREVVKAVDVV
ncbi:JAB domain-containing protein [Psychromonas ossibalaenae]|uniref:JAB domain-containing protein n=1 Tax=Psychromonas ossibalaenae TaxID=444922 RepID=UPI00037F007A